VRSPDEAAALKDAEFLLVGGRVEAVEDQGLILSGALGSLRVRLRPGASAGTRELQPGWLIVVQGALEAGVLVQASALHVQPAPLPTPQGEHARLCWQGVGPRLAARARAMGAARRHFDEQGFVEVETPLRVASPNLDANVEVVRAQDGWLITSPEYAMKRLLVGGLPRCYQFARCTRGHEQGPWHEPEFTMLEWYRSFAGIEATVADVEGLLVAVATAVSGAARLQRDGRSLELRPPFARLTVREAFRRFAGVEDAVALAAADEGRYYELLVSEVEPALMRQREPVVLLDYPLTQGALARPRPQEPTVVERFEIYALGVELCNGYGELTDATANRQRLAAEAMRLGSPEAPLPLDEAFLGALEEGLPPSSGVALGFDRLVALATGAPGVAEVSALPWSRRR